MTGRTTKIVCPTCKQLVEVVDKRVIDHDWAAAGELCPYSNMRYVPSPIKFGSAGGPKIEITATKTESCDDCGLTVTTVHGKISTPDPTNN